MDVRSESVPAPRRRGRPVTVSPDVVAATGLGLFVEQGFENTTMTSIAEAAGIGRKTLFGYFPSKADIVWNRFDRQLARLEAAFSEAPRSQSTTEAVVAAILTGLDTDERVLPAMRAEVVLIERTPELQSYAWMAGRPWRNAISAFIAEREGLDAAGVLPQVLGPGYWVAMFVGFRGWLRSGLESPLPAVEEALREYSRAIVSAFDDRRPADAGPALTGALPTTSRPGASPGPGRPRISSHATIERTAIDLFLRKGFDATTMDDIAVACGMGRTTVFRYFRFKEAILWYGFDLHIDDLRDRLASQPTSKPLSDGVCDAVVEAFTASEDDQGLWMSRFRVLQEAAGLSAETSHRWLLWANEVSTHVAERLGSAPEHAVLASALGGAVQATYLTTLRDWVDVMPDSSVRDATMRTSVEAVTRLFAPSLDS